MQPPLLELPTYPPHSSEALVSGSPPHNRVGPLEAAKVRQIWNGALTTDAAGAVRFGGAPPPGHPSGAAAAAPPAAAVAGEQTALDQQPLHDEKAMRRAFACEQAASWAAGDRWTSVVLAGLLLLGPVPRLLRQSASASRLAASLLEVAALAAPGVLAHTAPAWYQPRRSWVVAACRLASIHLLVLVLPPSPPPTAAWGGAIRFLAQTRALGLPLFAWANRLPLQVGRLLAPVAARQHGSSWQPRSLTAAALHAPTLQWLVWVHLAGTVEAARLSYTIVCQAPAFSGEAALGPLRRMAHAIETLAHWSPLPILLPPGAQPATSGGSAGARAQGGMACQPACGAVGPEQGSCLT